MTGFLKWGVALPSAIIGAVAIGATLAGVVEWSFGPMVALFAIIAADLTWRIVRKQEMRKRQQAELAAIAVSPRRRLIELDGRPGARHAA